METCWSYLVQSSFDLRGPYCTSCVNKHHRFKIDQLQRRNDLVLFIHLADRSEKRDYWKLQLENGSLSPFTISDESLSNLAKLTCADAKCETQTTEKLIDKLQNEPKEVQGKSIQASVQSKNRETQTTQSKYVNREVQTTPVNTPSYSNEILKKQSVDPIPIKTCSVTPMQTSVNSETDGLPHSKNKSNKGPYLDRPPFYTKSSIVNRPLNLSSSVVTSLQALSNNKVALATTSAKLRERYPNFAKEIQESRPSRRCFECNAQYSGFQPSVEHVFSARHLHVLNRDGNAFDQADFTFMMDLCGINVNVKDIIAEKTLLTKKEVNIRVPFFMPRPRNDISLSSPMVFDEHQRTSLAKMFTDQQSFPLLAKAYIEEYGKMLQEYQWKICQLCSVQVPNQFSHVQHILSIRHFNQAAERDMTFDESEMMSVKKLLFTVQEIQKKSQAKSIGIASTSSSTNDLPSVLVYVPTKDKNPPLKIVDPKAKNNVSSSTSEISATDKNISSKPLTTSELKSPVDTVVKVSARPIEKSAGTSKSGATSKTVEKSGSPAMQLTEKQIRSLKNIPLMFGATKAAEGVNHEEQVKHIELIGHELTKFSAETDFERLRDAFEVRGWTAKKCVFCVNDLDADYLCHVLKHSHRKIMNDKGYYHWKKDYQAILRVMILTYDAIEEANRPPLPFVNGTRDATKKIDDHLLMTNIRCFRLKLQEYLPESVEAMLEEQYRRIEYCRMCSVSLTSRNRLEHFISEDHIGSMLAKDRYFSKWDVHTMSEILLKLAIEDSKIRFQKVSSSQAEVADDALAWTAEQLDQFNQALKTLHIGPHTEKTSPAVVQTRPMPQQRAESSSSGSRDPEVVKIKSHALFPITSRPDHAEQPTPVPRSFLNSTLNEKKRFELERLRVQQAEKAATAAKTKKEDSCSIS